MLELTFAYWREPGSNTYYTVKDPTLQFLKHADILKEGFIVSPFNTQNELSFIQGRIESCDTLPDIQITTASSLPANLNVDYQTIVAKAINCISSGEFKKVVLARTMEDQVPQNFSLSHLFNQLASNFPKAFVYCFAIPGEVWIGASPEILLQKVSSEYKTFALAGTRVPGSSIPFGEKEYHEQAFVKEYILQQLTVNQCSDIKVSNLIEYNTGNLVHLLNEITFNTKDALKAIHSLHPTPAVCGYPLNAAKGFINSFEGIDRSFYSGYLGPIQKNGNFSLWVNLRCACLKGNKLMYYAGAGILEDSDPESEYLETERKMDTLRTLVFKS